MTLPTHHLTFGLTFLSFETGLLSANPSQTRNYSQPDRFISESQRSRDELFYQGGTRQDADS